LVALNKNLEGGLKANALTSFLDAKTRFLARHVPPWALQSVQGHAGLSRPGDCDKALAWIPKVTATAAAAASTPVSSHALLDLEVLSVPSYHLLLPGKNLKKPRCNLKPFFGRARQSARFADTFSWLQLPSSCPSNPPPPPTRQSPCAVPTTANTSHPKHIFCDSPPTPTSFRSL
jgi:hypothetical protein